MKVAIYASSSAATARGAALTAQLRRGREYAGQQGWSVVAEYSDRAVTPDAPLRPALDALVADTGRGDFQAVIVETMARLPADKRALARLRKRLTDAGVAIATVFTETSTAARKPSPRLRAPRPWTKQEIAEAFGRFRAANPEPKGELDYVNPYTLLVAVALSAQATDVGVNKATRHLFALADTPEKMVALGEERVRELIKTIGLFRTKAKNVIALSELLIANFGSVVPRSREELETLPGVGRKTANVVLNMAFGEPTIAVDTHLFRVGNRTGLAAGTTPLAVELKLERVIPAEFKRHAHHWLILHGRYTCIARKPLCGQCLINDLCRWPDKTV